MAATTLSSASLVVQGVAAAASALGSSHSSVHGSSLSVKQLLPVLAAAPRGAFGGCCKAEVVEQAATGSTLNVVPSLPRRLALALLAGSVAASFGRVAPAVAAYGEAANVFGSPKQQSGFTPYAGSGFKLNVPSKWNPSKESEFPGTVLRYEDNFDAKSNLSVMVTPTEKASITEFGSPQKFLESVSYLLGKQAYAGNTVSELQLRLF
ncbi:hypothetical protein O6H91_Y394700 [Diphasiastrum complanatum]|nr:hypothetical protein O6H91_Y394700 [Diphasiastrum complanatum]